MAALSQPWGAHPDHFMALVKGKFASLFRNAKEKLSQKMFFSSLSVLCCKHCVFVMIQVIVFKGAQPWDQRGSGVW